MEKNVSWNKFDRTGFQANGSAVWRVLDDGLLIRTDFAGEHVDLPAEFCQFFAEVAHVDILATSFLFTEVNGCWKEQETLLEDMTLVKET